MLELVAEEVLLEALEIVVEEVLGVLKTVVEEVLDDDGQSEAGRQVYLLIAKSRGPMQQT